MHSIKAEQAILENKDYRYKKSACYLVVKRIIDISGAFLGILFLSPFLILISLLIKLDSRGPVFFTQTRVGFCGREFKMYKFRSMIVDADLFLDELQTRNEMDGPIFKMSDDPRITRLGRFLRKTSIDELPQLINVLKGEMSLVGPRPNLPREVVHFNEYHRQKLLVKPGLTCYWQLQGRSSIGFEEWMKLDLRYIEERNTLDDLKLIIKTVRLLLGDENAR